MFRFNPEKPVGAVRTLFDVLWLRILMQGSVTQRTSWFNASSTCVKMRRTSSKSVCRRHAYAAHLFSN
jgi:hypothetical protein